MCVECITSTNSDSTLRPLGGWASPNILSNGLQCSLTVIGNALTFIRESQALVSLRYIAKPLQDSILSASKPPTMNELDCKSQYPSLWKQLEAKYNLSQLQAIETICRRCGASQPSLSLLQGPPGTGKTHTILGILAILLSSIQTSGKKGLKVIAGSTLKSSHRQQQSLSSSSSSTETSSFKKPRILVCAPSNTAVDELVYRLHSQGVLGINGERIDDLKIVRIGIPGGSSRASSSNNPAGPLSSSKNPHQQASVIVDDANNNILQVSEAHSLDHLVEERRKRIMSEMKHSRSYNQSDRISTNYMDLRKSILDQADIVCATLSGAGSQPIIEVVLRLTGFKFDAVIIGKSALCNSINSKLSSR
jgi:senataxin